MGTIKKKMPSINKQNIPEIGITNFEHGDIKHHFITAYPPGYGDTVSMLGRLKGYAQDNSIEILSQFVFGNPGIDKKKQFKAVSGNCSVTTYVHGDMPSPGLLYGAQAYCISGAVCTPVYLDGLLVGQYYEDEDAEYCFLGDICPGDKNLPPSEQALQTFEKIREALESIGMSFLHVVRTWFYLDGLFEWYHEFNEIRTAYFKEHGVFEHLIPASTGIGAGNLHGTHIVANVLAVKPKHPGVRITPVHSPMQCEATCYKSSFSRAVEIRFPAYRQLYISGTASIDNNGNSVHVGDINKQIDETMKVVGQIMESRSMGWDDAVRAIAYFKDIKHVTMFHDYCRENHLPYFPVCYSQSDICRRELLFEIEVDLIRVSNDGNNIL